MSSFSAHSVQRSLSRRRFGTLAVSMGAVAALAVSGCSTFTAQPYTPAVGTNVDQGDVKARGLVLVAGKSTARLVGGLISSSDDQLTGVAGTAQNNVGDKAGELKFGSTTITIPAEKYVPLTDTNISTEKGDLVPGLYADIQLTFKNAGVATVQVPVVDGNSPDYKTLEAKP